MNRSDETWRIPHNLDDAVDVASAAKVPQTSECVQITCTCAGPIDYLGIGVFGDSWLKGKR